MTRLKRWLRKGSESIYRCGIFDLNHVAFDPQDGRGSQRFYILDAPDWINVIPLTRDRQVLLIRQFRYGINGTTLEIPGGMCDPDESARDAAERELLEETGHTARAFIELGWVYPNPAIQTNRCYTYLARDVRRVSEPQPDANESFEQLSVSLDDIPDLISSQQIDHALVVAAFQLLRDRHLR